MDVRGVVLEVSEDQILQGVENETEELGLVGPFPTPSTAG